MTNYDDRAYFEELHRVTIPKPGDGDKLGLTVQQRDNVVVVTRILAGGLADLSGLLQLGDVVVEVNNIPINSAEDLSALVAMADKKIHFLVKKTPEKDLKKYGIPNTPSLRKQINDKIVPEQRVLCHVRALFDYDPFQDNLVPCPEAALGFMYNDILAVVNKDDANWWQAKHVHTPHEPARLIPSLELEERRKAFVPPESNYTSKIGLCGSLISKKKRKEFFHSKSNAKFDKAELQLYEEVTLMKPFRRKTLILVGASGIGRRTLKNRIINSDPENYGSPLPHTSRLKRPEEDNGQRYWFVDREDMEFAIHNHEFLEYGELNGHYYGTKLDSIRAVIDQGKTCVLDCSAQALKLLKFSSEFMPYVIFLAAPGLDEMRHIYDNQRVTNNLMTSSKTLSNFERTSSIRHSSRRAKTMSSLTSLYVEEDVMKNLEESGRLQRAFANYFDLIIINESHDQTFRQTMDALYGLSVNDQWVPSCWVYS